MKDASRGAFGSGRFPGKRVPGRFMAWITAALVLPLAAPVLHAQAAILLDVDSMRASGGSVSFQFEASFGTSSDFDVDQADALGAPWSPRSAAMVEAVAEGVFRASIPMDGAGQRWFRVRSRALPPIGPAPVINEVMLDNDTAIAAVPGRFWDWIELYNPEDEAIDLDGYTLANEREPSPPLPLPATVLQPGAHRVVWATDDAHALPAGALAVPVTLRSGGASLVLRDRFGREVARGEIPPLGPNRSLGRTPDGADTWRVFEPTSVSPGRTNGPSLAAVVVEPPRMSPPGGIHAGPVDVVMAAPRGAVAVAYTLDGSPAHAGSPRATGPLRITRSTAVRAVALDPAGRASSEVVHSYLLGVTTRLPIVAVAASPTNFGFLNGYLVGMGTGVLGTATPVLANFPFEPSNAWKDREAAVHVEFIEPGGAVAFRQHAGMKVHGGWGSRGYPQKSFALYARRKYGSGSFDHEVFPGLGVQSFESLVLRNSGNDNQSTHQTVPRPPITQFGPASAWGSYFVRGNFTLMRDALLQSLLSDTGLDTQAYRPAVLYVNGEYWGIHNLREKTSEHPLLSRHELPKGSIDLIEGYGSPRAGTANAYVALRDYLNVQGVAAASRYDYVASTYLDVDNFIDYHLAVIAFQNFDIGNIKCWRPRTPKGRFRWIVYDQDYGFGLWPDSVYPAAMARDYADYSNMFRFATAGTGTSTSWPNGGGRTLMLRRMLANAGFKERFIRRCADLLNSALREDRVASALQAMAAVIRPEIPAHLERWGWPSLVQRGFGLPHQREPIPFTLQLWETNVASMAAFGAGRPAQLRSQCISHFGLQGGLGTLEVRVAGAGRVRVNTLCPTSYPWTGIYFGDYATTLRAAPEPGHRFVGWTFPGGISNAAPRVDRFVGNNAVEVVTARFEPIPSAAVAPVRLVVSEINYHAPDDLDPGDWIELLNPNAIAVSLGGWSLRDGSKDGVFYLPDVVLAPGARCVVARNRAKFQLAHPNGIDPVAELTFGLDNGGDSIRLFDPTGMLVEAVTYDDVAPWPATADGGGSTLQRIDPASDPGVAASWRASSTKGGSPGGP